MGLFSTIGNSVFFIRSAQKINDYQKQIAFLVNKNQYATVIPQHDKMQILGYAQQIEDVAIEMRNKLNSLSPQEQFSIMVPSYSSIPLSAFCTVFRTGRCACFDNRCFLLIYFVLLIEIRQYDMYNSKR